MAVAPVLADLSINGDYRCSPLQVTPQNDGSILVQMNNPIPLTSPCRVAFNPLTPGDDDVAGANEITPTSGFTVDIVTQPALTNISNPEFTVGQPVSFELTPVNTSYINLNGVLPSGLTFASYAPGPAFIRGTPVAGSGGEYKVPVVVSNNVGTATQILDIKVFEPPTITSRPYVNATVGQSLTYPVVASGYPSNSPISCNAMQFNLFNPFPFLPVTSSNENVAQSSTNTLKVTLPVFGPLVANLEVTAANSVGANSQPLQVIYHVPGAANLDGVASCTDVLMIEQLMGAHYGNNNFVSIADLNNDGVIDGKDLLLVTRSLPSGTRCPSLAH